ncbi:hypothetical protein Tco_1065989 [Tanacetum coccineum]
MENQVMWESKQEDLKRPQPEHLVFYGPQRNLNEPPRYLYNKDLFFLKNGNSEDKKIVKVVRVTTEEQYGLNFMQQIIMMRESDKLGCFSKGDFKYLNKNDIEDIYQIKINLIAPTLTFTGIEASLEKLLKEVKLKIIKTEFKMKTPLLGKLDLKIMKAYELEIVKRLNLSAYARNILMALSLATGVDAMGCNADVLQPS